MDCGLDYRGRRRGSAIDFAGSKRAFHSAINALVADHAAGSHRYAATCNNRRSDVSIPRATESDRSHDGRERTCLDACDGKSHPSLGHALTLKPGPAIRQ